jgi:hypothetical protein
VRGRVGWGCRQGLAYLLGGQVCISKALSLPARHLIRLPAYLYSQLRSQLVAASALAPLPCLFCLQLGRAWPHRHRDCCHAGPAVRRHLRRLPALHPGLPRQPQVPPGGALPADLPPDRPGE